MKPIFKFKKAEVKMLGDFNVLSIDEYDLLCKKGFMNEVEFIHIRKLWNIEETADELDSDGNVVTPGNKAKPIYGIVKGFSKDGKFIVTDTHSYGESTFTQIHTRYVNALTALIDLGWKKDDSNYIGDKPIKPVYYKNEKTASSFDIESLNSISPQQSKIQPTPKVSTSNVPSNANNTIHKILRSIKIK